MSQPWERREGETSKAFAAFCAYRDMGAGRSLEKLGRSWGKPAGYQKHLEAWSSKHEWESRADAWLDYLDSERRKAVVESERSKAMQQHLETSRLAAQKMIDFGLAALHLAQRSVGAYTNLPPESVQPSEAAGLARSALANLQIGLDAQAHSLGVETAVKLLEAEDGREESR